MKACFVVTFCAYVFVFAVFTAGVRRRPSEHTAAVDQLTTDVHGDTHDPHGDAQPLAQHPVPVQVKEAAVNNDEPNLQANAGGVADHGQSPLAKEMFKRRGQKGWKIVYDPDCRANVLDVCQTMKPVELEKNFDVLDCLDKEPAAVDLIGEACQHVIWEYKKSLSLERRFEDSAARGVCAKDRERLSECKNEPDKTGRVLACMIQHRQNVSDQSCFKLLTRLSAVVFSDFRFVDQFISHCQDSIRDKKCGRLSQKAPEDLHGHGSVIACLLEEQSSLPRQCQHEILRLAELQSDDFHLDSALYFACRGDRERFCAGVRSGGGRVYKCLFEHKQSDTMSRECGNQLRVRQRLMQEDAKVNFALWTSCQNELHQLQCKIPESDNIEEDPAKLFIVLDCLNKGALRGDNVVTPECKVEMKEMQQSLMEDYEISPTIVVSCQDDIDKLCSHGLERGGKTLHCLMDAARPRPEDKFVARLSATCLASLEDLLSVAHADDLTIDPVLGAACEPSVVKLCKHVRDNHNALSCLAANLHHNEMARECRERIIEIQYFTSRKWEMDDRLWRACKSDATKRCGYKPHNKAGPVADHMTLSCLYRHITVDSGEDALVPKCKREVERVRRERADEIDLHPEIEMQCVRELGTYCNDVAQKAGGELACLQENMEKPDITPDCAKAMDDFTTADEDAPILEKIMMDACASMVEKLCKDEADRDDDESGEILMNCLIENKNHPEMDKKCAAGITHHQIVGETNFHYSKPFTKHCSREAEKWCKHVLTEMEEKPSMRKEKWRIVHCLADYIRNDTLFGDPQRVAKTCRRQLKLEVLQRNENVKELDPELAVSCSTDITKHCGAIDDEQGKMLECLRAKDTELTPKCYKKVFDREQVEAVLPSTDVQLQRRCKRMIKHFCKDVSADGMFRCLVTHKNDDGFTPRCREVVIKREHERSKHFQLQPQLFKRCRKSIQRHCKKELQRLQDAPGNAADIQGTIVNCLKQASLDKAKRAHMSRDCKQEIKLTIREAQRDYQNDPVLIDQCVKERESVDAPGESSPSRIEECLRQKFENNELSTNMKCYKIAPPVDLRELGDQILESPSRNYFLILIMSVLFILFIFGLVTGRVTKKLHVDLKNKTFAT